MFKISNEFILYIGWPTRRRGKWQCVQIQISESSTRHKGLMSDVKVWGKLVFI